MKYVTGVASQYSSSVDEVSSIVRKGRHWIRCALRGNGLSYRVGEMVLTGLLDGIKMWLLLVACSKLYPNNK